MDNGKYKAPLDLFSECFMAIESDDYPKTDFTQIGLRGKIDFGAFSEAYSEAIALLPIFSSHLIEERHGLFHQPYWVFDREVLNLLQIVDCRHMAGDDPFDPMDFSTRYYAKQICRSIDLTREFPFNCSLLRVKDDRYILSILYHHSTLDPNKAFHLLTELFSRYHRKVTGKPPEWADALGIEALKREGGLIKPICVGPFIKQQLVDVCLENRASRIDQVASQALRDFSTCKGRHSLRYVIDDPKLIEGLMARVKKNNAAMNDLIMAVARMAIARWNEKLGKTSDRFRMMLITNLTGRTKLPPNAGAGISAISWVHMKQGITELDSIIQHYRDIRKTQLSQGMDILCYDLISKFIAAMRVFPLKLRLKILHSLAQTMPCTFYLSNIGVMWPRFENGRPTTDSVVLGAGDFIIDDIHSSASIGPGIGLGLTTRTHNRKFYLNFVADRFRFRKAEAQKLFHMIVKDLINAA
jgi:NRPS condensation-like uncharacterized protein